MGFSDVMTWGIGILLVSAALLTVVRIITGPSVLDRVVASDVLVSIVVCALGAQTALMEGPSTMGLLITLSLVGFMGSVAVARFVARDRDYPVDFDEPDTLEDPDGDESDPDDPTSFRDPDRDDAPDRDAPDQDEAPDRDEPESPGITDSPGTEQGGRS